MLPKRYATREKSTVLAPLGDMATTPISMQLDLADPQNPEIMRRGVELSAADPEHSWTLLVLFLQFRLQRAPVELAWNHGFSPRELNEIRHMVLEYEHIIIEAWNEHCGQR